MLIEMTLENWLSFRDATTFYMSAGHERHHSGRLSKIGSRLKLLPISAIYGGNASGKSNFVDAVKFARDFILYGTKDGAPVPVRPFALDETADAPSFFRFEFLIDSKIYEYSFQVTRQKVLHEKLLRIMRDGGEKIIFDIDRTEESPNFSFPQEKDGKKRERLRIYLEGTQANKLFITNAKSQKIDDFDDVFKWFNNLEIITPGAYFRFSPEYIEENNFIISDYIKNLDTGIADLVVSERPVQGESYDYYEKQMTELNADSIPLQAQEGDIAVVKKDGRFFSQELGTVHNGLNNRPIPFSFSSESDGTKRILHLLPLLIKQMRQKEEQVFIVDELDRSLHSQLTRWFLESFLSNCDENTRTQLIFTTHDTSLLDQELLRRDEIWFAERMPSGASRLFSLAEYRDVRADMDLPKNYLLGSFGGIPAIRKFLERSSNGGI